MKTFRQFMVEISASDIPSGDPGYGGGTTSDANINANTEATAKQKEELRRRAAARRAKDSARTSSSSSGSGGASTAQQPSGGSGGASTAQQPSGGSGGVTPRSWKSSLKTGTGRALKGGIGALSAVNTVQSLKDKDYSQAAQSALLTGASSSRLNQGAAALGRRAVTSAATRAGMQGVGKVASRFVPGLQTAAGLVRGSTALAKGDVVGAGLGYASAIPGPIGWAGAGADIARDVVMPYDAKKQQTSDVQSSRKTGAQYGKYGARYGSAITGTGGPTTVSRQAGTVTSGGKTAKLGSTQLIRDPKTGKQTVGDLAYKGGKATYLARPSAASSDTNLFSRLSRATGIGGQRERDSAASKKDYRTALRSTQNYQKQLGITPKAATAQKLPGRGVGPKLVGPKIVGPGKAKPVKPARPQSPAQSLIKPA